MNIENCLVSKVMYKQDIGEVLDKGVSESMFFDLDMKRAMKYIREFYMDYSELPSLDLFETEFPDVKLEHAKEPVGFYIDKLKEQFVRNKAQEALLKHAPSILSNPLEGLEALKGELSDIETETNESKDVDMSMDTDDRKKRYEQASQGIDGYFTPWETLDEVTRGIHKKEYWSIVARPATGKSWILSLFADKLRGQDLNVGIASEEMPIEQFERRLDAIRYKLPYEQLRQGMLLEPDKKRYFAGLDAEKKNKAKSLKLTNVVTISALKQKAKNYKWDVLLIDGAYLLADDHRGGGITERVTNISRDCKRACNSLGIPIVAVWQFNRNAEGSKEPGLADINWADAVGQDSDVAMGIVCTNDMKVNKERKIVMMKVREGELKNFMVKFDLDEMDFTDYGADDGVTIDDEDEDIGDTLEF